MSLHVTFMSCSLLTLSSWGSTEAERPELPVDASAGWRRVEHDLSDSQWAALCAAWSGCAYCGMTGTALQRDCVLAISRGGRYTLENVVPACRCLQHEQVQPRGHGVAPPEEARRGCLLDATPRDPYRVGTT